MNIYTLKKFGTRITIKHGISVIEIYVSQNQNESIETNMAYFHITKMYKRAWYKKFYNELCKKFESLKVFDKQQIYDLLLTFRKDFILYEGI